MIRDNLEVDEGDPFNAILLTKSINNLKSLNIFGSVDYNIEDVGNKKILNINVEEKPLVKFLLRLVQEPQVAL